MGDAKLASGDTQRRRVLYISAGASHTVALLSGDIVCSWGRGEDGQLGHGDAEERHLPTINSSLVECEITAITCGADHTTAVSDSTRSVYSWGWGDFGRLGHGNSSDLFIPHPIKALSGLQIKHIACGDSHCLAITADGDVHSWGRNQNGQLGLGHNDDVLIPRKVTAFEGIAVKMLAAGAEHTAAVTENGKLYGWGWGRYGNLGLGDRNDRLVPGEVASVMGERFSLVACGWRHTIAVADSGNLYTFGWSKYGQLGHGDYLDHLVPFQVDALKNKRIVQTLQTPTSGSLDLYTRKFDDQISGGWRHTVALDCDGRLHGWGWNKVSAGGGLNDFLHKFYRKVCHSSLQERFECSVYVGGFEKIFGQVGVGDTDDQNSPQLVKNLGDQKVTQVSCGWRHTICITAQGNVYSWGRGTSGQLGHGDAVDRSVPRRIEALSVDGLGCQQLESSRSTSSNACNWISPSERYAVVPVETVRSLSRGLHQGANVGEGETTGGSDASVPVTDVKRMRTGH